MTSAAAKTLYPKGENFLLLPPTRQAFAYRNVDRMFATRAITRGQVACHLDRATEIDVRYTIDGRVMDIDGRFGLFVAGGGVAGDEAVLSDPWVDAANRVSFEVAPQDNSYGAVGYGYSWWIDEDGAMVAVGFAGQSLYVNRARGVVIVKLSCQPQPPYATANTVDFRRERTLSRTPSSAANRKRLSPVSLLKL